MKRLTAILLLTGLSLILAFPAWADRGSSYRDRMEHQKSMIERGIRSGELTEREARRLRTEQREIRDLADELRDSRMPRERRHRILNARLDRAEQHIRELTRNEHRSRDYRPPRGDHRPGGYPPPPYWDRGR